MEDGPGGMAGERAIVADADVDPIVDAVAVSPASVPRERLWPVVLTLYLLAPMTGELMSGSTPPLAFLSNPFAFVFVPLLYGSSAVLIHEVAVRRRLGWGNILLLGAAFGIFQEALVVQTWFTYAVPASPSYAMRHFGILFGMSWLWALSLTFYHAVISIALPLVLLGLLFPRRSKQPWLKRGGMLGFVLWLMLPCLVVGIGTAAFEFRQQGYIGPPAVGYLLAAALLALALVFGVRLRLPAPHPNPSRHAPALWTVRLTCFGLTTLYFALYIALPGTQVPALLAMVALALVVACGLWRVWTWSARAGWNARHQLAVVTGVLGFFLVLWGPLLEFGLHKPTEVGLTLVNALIFVGFVALDWRLKRREAARFTTAPAEAPFVS